MIIIFTTFLRYYWDHSWHLAGLSGTGWAPRQSCLSNYYALLGFTGANSFWAERVVQSEISEIKLLRYLI